MTKFVYKVKIKCYNNVMSIFIIESEENIHEEKGLFI